MNNKNITIVITGCSTGIGFDAAIQLHTAFGYNVIGTCRKEKDVNRLRNLNIKCVQMDLASSDSIQKAYKEIEYLAGGKIDVLFNNAGFGVFGATEDLSRDAMLEQFQTNVFGTQELTNLVVANMKHHGGGKIFYNSSILGFVPMYFRGAYSASKAAIESLASTLRIEVKNYNIKVSIIQPGPIKTSFKENALAMFKKHIDADNSHYKDPYINFRNKLSSSKKAPFTLEAKAVRKCLMHGIKAKSPKRKYRVTFPTKLFGVLTRVLPTFMIDNMLIKSGEDGRN